MQRGCARVRVPADLRRERRLRRARRAAVRAGAAEPLGGPAGDEHRGLAAAGLIRRLARTQISLLGAPASALSGVSASGSHSGAHPGRLIAYSQGDGASFVPSQAVRSGRDGDRARTGEVKHCNRAVRLQVPRRPPGHAAVHHEGHNHAHARLQRGAALPLRAHAAAAGAVGDGELAAERARRHLRRPLLGARAERAG